MTAFPKSRRFRGATRWFALVAALLVAASGCGGSDDAPAARSQATAATATQTAEAPSKQAPSAQRRQPKLPKPSKVTKADVERALAKAPSAPVPRRVPVKVPAAGDKSIQTFGSAGAGGEFAAIARTVRAFNYALAARDTESVCALLAARMRAQIQLLVSRAGEKQGRKGSLDCAGAVKGLLRQTAGAAAEQLRSIRVTDARIKAGRGFAIYRMRGQGEMAEPVVLEEGHWRVGALGGVPLD